MTIVERMARMMCEDKFPGQDPNSPSIAGTPMWAGWAPQARAALRAVRPEDVSDGMVEAFLAAAASPVVHHATPGERLVLLFGNARRAIAAAINAGGE